MLYLCEVTRVSDPQGINRVKSRLLSEPDLGETEWMFCISSLETPLMPQVGDLVWASVVNAEQNVYAWHSIVPLAHRRATLNQYMEFFETPE